MTRPILPPLLRAVPIPTAALDLQGRILDANQALLSASGYAPGDLAGAEFSAFLEPADPDAAERFRSVASGAADSYSVSRRFRSASGAARDVDVHVSLVRDAAGAPEMCLAVLQDTTEHKRALAEAARNADALTLSETRYRALVDQSPLSIQILAPDGTTLHVNAAWERLWGATLEQLAGYNMLQDPQLVARGIMPYIRRGFAGEPVQVPAVLYDPAEVLPDPGDRHDRRRWVRAVMYPLKDGHGAVREVVLIHEDMTEQVLAHQRRMEATGLLELLVEQSGEAIIVADAQGVVRIFNPAAERLHGVKGDATPPENWAEHYRLLRLDGTPLPFTESALYRAIHGELVRDSRWQVSRDDGSTMHIVGTAAPLRTPDGESAGAVLIARDETARIFAERERERLLVETQRAHGELEAASRVKDEFLAVLSHELRTPMNAVLGWTRILQRRPLDSETAHAAAVIERNAIAQARLIDDLLDVSGIITGQLALHPEPMDIRDTALSAIETVKPAATARGVRLRVEVESDLPITTGDPERLQQVLWNLLSNAVKFTEPGGQVSLLVNRDERHIVMTVEDTGIGMRPDILPFMFDRFRQGDASSTRAHSGLGLGLAIVRHLVELHGGTVTGTSTGVNRGSTFRVRIPLSNSLPPSPA